jgi:hypothetical protein
MRLAGMRFAESVGDPRGRRNVTLGVIQHLWRSPVPFVAFYPPEGARITEQRLYAPAPPRQVDDTEYLAGVEAHKRAFAKDLEDGMVPAGRLPGYFEVSTDEGWRIVLDLAEGRLGLPPQRPLHRDPLRQRHRGAARRPALRRKARGRRAPVAPDCGLRRYLSEPS